MAPKRTSKLEAINRALMDSQLYPVESLNSGDPDAEIAELTLDEIHLDVMTFGFHFNSRTLDFVPDINKNIILADNILKADAVDTSIDVVQIENKLFNKTTNSYLFDGPVRLKIFISMDWEELPQTARKYISKETSRVLQLRILGDGTLNNNIMDQARDAWGQLKREDIQMKDHNVIRSGRTSMGIINRRRPWG